VLISDVRIGERHVVVLTNFEVDLPFVLPVDAVGQISTRTGICSRTAGSISWEFIRAAGEGEVAPVDDGRRPSSARERIADP
jgi:hypothetical protein